jgi:hypothetical protein
LQGSFNVTGFLTLRRGAQRNAEVFDYFYSVKQLLVFFLFFISAFCYSFDAAGQNMIADTATFIIRNISYHEKIYLNTDSTKFRITTYGVPALKGNPAFYVNNAVLTCTVILHYKEGEAAQAMKHMDFFIAPANEPIARDQLMVSGIFHGGCVYVLDTLFYCCSPNVLTIPDTATARGDTLHIPGKTVTNSFVIQQRVIIDSIFLARKKMISENKILSRLNTGKTLVDYSKRSQCSDSIITRINLELSENKMLVTDFYANGNINRIYTYETYTEWKWFYHHRYYDDGDHRRDDFYLLKKLRLFHNTDTCTNYYPNGKKYKQTVSFPDNNSEIGMRIVNAWDTNGVQTLFNGTGYYTEYGGWQGYDHYTLKHYKNYQLDGEYNSYAKGYLNYSAEYKNGVLYSEQRWGHYIQGGDYHSSLIFNPANATYILTRFDVDGKQISQQTFTALQIGTQTDYSVIYYYPSVNDAPH